MDGGSSMLHARDMMDYIGWMKRIVACTLLMPTLVAATPPASLPAGIGAGWMTPPDSVGALADPDPWAGPDATATGLDDMIRNERRAAGEVLTSARRGDDPAGPPADERLLRTLRKVGGDSVIVPVFKLHLDR